MQLNQGVKGRLVTNKKHFKLDFENIFEKLYLFWKEFIYYCPTIDVVLKTHK
jgi:hypothetical protein